MTSHGPDGLETTLTTSKFSIVIIKFANSLQSMVIEQS